MLLSNTSPHCENPKGRTFVEATHVILDDADPTVSGMKFIEALKKIDLSKPPTTTSYVLHSRNTLLVTFSLVAPIPMEHLRNLTWKSDDTGQLRRIGEKQWGIRIPSKQFQGLRIGTRSDYSVNLPKWTTDIIVTYLANNRPRLQGAGECDFVFRPIAGPTASLRGTAAMEAASLTDIVHRATSSIIGSPGCGPNDMRRIAAMNLIMHDKTGNPYPAIAELLHISVPKAKKDFAHIKV